MTDMSANQKLALVAIMAVATVATAYSSLAHSGGAAGAVVLKEPPAAAASIVSARQAPVASGTSLQAAPPIGATPAGGGDPAEVVVHVVGAVRRPGVYHLHLGARGEDAVHAAGGAAAGANTDAVNLAARLEDGEQLFIPTRKQDPAAHAAMISAAVAADGGPPSAAALSGPAPGAVRETRRGVARGAGRAGKLSDPSQGKIDVNSADATTLQQLPGIGPAMAERILAYRSQNGPFRTVDDLRNVSGIGDKKLAKLTPFVRLR